MHATRRKRRPPPTRVIIERARKDLAEGQENTDCHEADRPMGSHCDVPAAPQPLKPKPE